MKVINFFAGPGAGKSTTAAELFAALKRQEVNCELITEVAKDLTWEGRHNVLRDDQLYVTAKQHRRLLRLEKRVDYAITDSPLLLGLMYRPDDYLTKSYDNLVHELWENYVNINFFIKREKAYNPVGRNQSEDEAKEIDQKVRDFLDRNAINYHVIPGNNSAVPLIQNYLDAQ